MDLIATSSPPPPSLLERYCRRLPPALIVCLLSREILPPPSLFAPDMIFPEWTVLRDRFHGFITREDQWIR